MRKLEILWGSQHNTKTDSKHTLLIPAGGAADKFARCSLTQTFSCKQASKQTQASTGKKGTPAQLAIKTKQQEQRPPPVFLVLISAVLIPLRISHRHSPSAPDQLSMSWCLTLCLELEVLPIRTSDMPGHLSLRCPQLSQPLPQPACSSCVPELRRDPWSP